MAEEKSPPELNIHLLECAICLEQVQQPKTLPCRHYFCQDCLETYIDKELSGKMASATSFPCPVCRRMTSPVNPAKSKNKWAAQFPANALIQDFANVKERSSKPLFCTPCQTKENLTNPASYWCKMMETAFCQNCKLNYHDVIHRRCEMTDISGQVLPSKPENFHPRCDTHDKKMTWYCEDHHILGCSKCMIKNHKACDGVMTATDYIQKLKTGSHLSDMQSMLFKWKEAMESLVRSFDVQLKTMAKNQDIFMQSIADLRKMIDKRLDELQKDVTDKLVTLCKEERGNVEATMQQCQCLINSMLKTMESSIKAEKENDNIGTIEYFQRGKAEVESCKTMFTEASKSNLSIHFKHEIVPGLLDHLNDSFGKVVIEKQPGIGGHLVTPVLLGSQGKEIRKIRIKTSSDTTTCNARGILYLTGNRFVVSDSNNKKLKLFTDTGEYLDELAMEGYPCDMCLVNSNVFAVAVYSPGRVYVVEVLSSRLSLSSVINMPNGKDCYGITHTAGMFIVGAGRGEVYRITLDGAADLLHKYQATCYSLTQNPFRNDTLVSVCSATEGAVALSRLSAVKRHTNVMKVGVIRSAMGVDVDREGNIYICGRDSHNVVQMSGDGRRVKKLLTSSDGIDRPWAISVHDDKFLVTTICCDYIRVFRLY